MLLCYSAPGVEGGKEWCIHLPCSPYHTLLCVLGKIRSSVKHNIKIIMFIIMQVVRCLCQSQWKINFCCPCSVFFLMMQEEMAMLELLLVFLGIWNFPFMCLMWFLNFLWAVRRCKKMKWYKAISKAIFFSCVKERQSYRKGGDKRGGSDKILQGNVL